MAAANDLTAHAPRRLDAELEGYAWLPRMLDKARPTAETAGSYPFGCPVDHTFMARLAIAPGPRRDRPRAQRCARRTTAKEKGT